MNTEKKTFAPAEVEIIRFAKNDVIATSGNGCSCNTVNTVSGVTGESGTETEIP